MKLTRVQIYTYAGHNPSCECGDCYQFKYQTCQRPMQDLPFCGRYYTHDEYIIKGNKWYAENENSFGARLYRKAWKFQW